MAKKEVAKKEGTQMAMASSMMSDAGMGMENVDKDSFAIPYFSILQPLSPQLDKNDGAFIKGAEQGQLLNTVTGEVFDEAVVLPVAYKREIIEWVPRAKGGGLAGKYEVGQEPSYTVEEGKWKTEDGNDLADTRQHYVLILDGSGGFTPAVMSMSSSQIKKSKRWMTMMQNFKVEQDGQKFTPPTFAVKYHVSSVQESNEKGKWHGWTIKTEGLLSEDEMELYSASKDFHNAVQAGEVKVAEAPQEVEVNEDQDW